MEKEDLIKEPHFLDPHLLPTVPCRAIHCLRPCSGAMSHEETAVGSSFVGAKEAEATDKAVLEAAFAEAMMSQPPPAPPESDRRGRVFSFTGGLGSRQVSHSSQAPQAPHDDCWLRRRRTCRPPSASARLQGPQARSKGSERDLWQE